jgi:hypothetical protein
MENWLATAPLTDNLDQPGSCVFIWVSVGGKWLYFCRLCSRTYDPADLLDAGNNQVKIHAHLADPIHNQRAALLVQVRNDAFRRFGWSLQFQRDWSYYRSTELESAIFRHCFAGSSTSQAAVEQQLEELRLGEPMVLLELALWKAACELSPPDDHLSPLRKKDWARSGWKELKPTMRKDPLTGIAALVAPFLGLKKKAKTKPNLAASG